MQREWREWRMVRRPKFPQRFLLCFIFSISVFFSVFTFCFRVDIEPRVRGVHRLGQLDSRHRLQSSCSQIACNFIFVCKYVFLVRCVAARRKTGTRTALTSNYTAACLGGRLGWALVCWRGKRLNTPEAGRKMARGRTLVRQPQAQRWVLFYSHACVVDWSDGREWFATNQANAPTNTTPRLLQPSCLVLSIVYVCGKADCPRGLNWHLLL